MGDLDFQGPETKWRSRREKVHGFFIACFFFSGGMGGLFFAVKIWSAGSQRPSPFPRLINVFRPCSTLLPSKSCRSNHNHPQSPPQSPLFFWSAPRTRTRPDFLFRFLRNETALFWIRCELFTQWGLLSNQTNALTTMSTHCTKGKQCRKNMFFKYRNDNRQQDQKLLRFITNRNI